MKPPTPPELDAANPPGSAGEERGYTETKPDTEPQEGGRIKNLGGGQYSGPQDVIGKLQDEG